MDKNSIKKFFVARNAEPPAPDASQMIVAFAEDDKFGYQVDPKDLIGKKITNYEFIETNIGKTLIMYVE